MVRVRCALLDADMSGRAAFVDVDVKLSTTVMNVRVAMKVKLHHIGPAELWKLYVAQQDDDGTWPSCKVVRAMTRTDLLGRSSPLQVHSGLDPTLRLDSEKVLGPQFRPTLNSDCVHLLAVAPPRLDLMTLQCAVLHASIDRDEDVDKDKDDGIVAFFDLVVERTQSVSYLQAVLELQLVDRGFRRDSVCEMYVARHGSDSCWPDHDTVSEMTISDVLDSGRPALDLTWTLDSDECLGPDFQSPIGVVHILVLTTSKRRRLANALEVRCAVLEAKVGNIAGVTTMYMTLGDTVADLKAALTRTHAGTIPFNSALWQVYVAQQVDGTWLNYGDVHTLTAREVEQSGHYRRLDPFRVLERHDTVPETCFHVLLGVTPKMYVVQDAPRTQSASRSDLQRVASWGVDLSRLQHAVDVDQWGDDDCGSLKCLDLPVSCGFPASFYVRKELLMVWRAFKVHFQSRFESNYDAAAALRDRQRLLLRGSPGVGKTSVLLLMCLYLAVKQDRWIVLVQKKRGNVARVLLFTGDTHTLYAWESASQTNSGWEDELAYARCMELVACARDESAKSPQSSQLSRLPVEKGRVWICTDGLSPNETESVLPGLSIDLAALPYNAYFPDQFDGTRATKMCLVPHWQEQDIHTLGRLYGMREEECDARYYVSGGSLQLFMDGVEKARDVIRRAVDRLVWARDRGYAPRVCQSTADLIFSLGLVDISRMEDYTQAFYWDRTITSAFARELLPKGCGFLRV